MKSKKGVILVLTAAFLFIGGVLSVHAQDMVILRDGSVIEARVTEISPTEIRYRRFNHLDGPVIVIPRSNVLSIRYQNGTVEIIGAPAAATQNTQSSRSQNAAQSATQGASQTNQQTGEVPRIPVLGEPTLLQQGWNQLPAIGVGNYNLKFEFGGDTWIAKNNGRNFLAGTMTFEETPEGTFLVLKQTHTYPPRDIPRISWVRTPGPEIILQYNPGPPSSFARVPRPQSLPASEPETASSRSRQQRGNQREQRQQPDVENSNKFNSIGLSFGLSMIDPKYSIGLYGTKSLSRGFYLEPGIEFGFRSKWSGWGNSYSSVSGYYYDNAYENGTFEVSGYKAIYPYINIGYFKPFRRYGGFFFGTGLGYMFSWYSFEGYQNNNLWNGGSSNHTAAVNFKTGFNIANFINISYNLRTDFSSANSGLVFGVGYRFK